MHQLPSKREPSHPTHRRWVRAALVAIWILAVPMLATTTAHAQQEQWLLTGSIDGASDNWRLGLSSDLSDDGNTVVVGAPHLIDDNTRGAIQIYDRIDGKWRGTHRASGHPSPQAEGFGYEVAISGDGNTVAVNEVGSVRFFRRSPQGSWAEIPGIEGQNISYGWALDLNGDGTRVVVGEMFHAESSGRAQVFAFTGAGWTQVGNDFAVGGAEGDMAGNSVGINGDGTVVIVGSIGAFESFGAAQVFAFDETDSWEPVGDVLYGEEGLVRFGRGVDISNDATRVIAHSDRGFSVFDRLADAWQLIGSFNTLTLPGTTAHSTAISGDGTHIVLGTSHGGSGNGAWTVLERAGTSWVLVGDGIVDPVNSPFQRDTALSVDGSSVVVSSAHALDGRGMARMFSIHGFLIDAEIDVDGICCP